MKRIVPLALLVCMACTTAQINQALSDANKMATSKKPLTSTEVGAGLKEALVNGISKGSDLVSQTDGYFKNPEIKIPFPPDVKKVEDRLRQIGLGAEVDKFVMTINRGAEDAAKEAMPIFIAVIKQMTIDDAFALLKGDPDAATQFLKRTTSAQLKEKFKPIIQTSLNKVSATKYYDDIITRYNKIPLVQKVNPDLNDYVTDMAIQGILK